MPDGQNVGPIAADVNHVRRDFVTIFANQSAATKAQLSCTLAEKLWAIPAARMKAGKEHRVPLSDAAVAILAALPRVGDYVFPGGKAGRPLSNMALLMLLRRMTRDAVTAHGFRSTFRDWAAEKTSFPTEVAEMALAHTVGDKVEAAYRRGDLFEKRRQLAEAWTEFCAG